MDWKRANVSNWCVHDSERGCSREDVGRTELDEVADSAHDQEADTDGLGDLEELLLVSCREDVLVNSLGWMKPCVRGQRGARTLLAPVHELEAVLDELPRNVEDLLYLVRHGCCMCCA